MVRRPPGSTRTDTLFPDTTLFRSDVDAISCGSDQIARGVCDRLRELGRAVPDDVAVTGLDNWSVMALASRPRSEEHTSELQSLMRISYAVFCLNKKKKSKEKSTYSTIERPSSSTTHVTTRTT